MRKTLFALTLGLTLGVTVASAATVSTFDSLITTNRNATSTFKGNVNVTGTTTLATTTSPYINGVIVVDGVQFPRTNIGINNALALCSSYGGGEVYAPSGVYSFAAQVTMRSHCSLKGAGTSTIFFLSNEARTNLFYGVDVHNITMSDFTIDGNKYNQTYAPGGTNANGIFLDSENATTSNILIERVTIRNMKNNAVFAGRGMLGTPTVYAAVDGLIVRDSVLKDSGTTDLDPGTYGRGFQISRGVSNVTLENNVITGHLGVGIESGGQNYDGTTNKNVKILNNYIKNNPVYGIDLGGQESCIVRDNLITNDLSAASSSYGIFLESVPPATTGCTIEGNTVSYQDIYSIYIAGDNRFVTIEGNHSSNVVNSGLTGAFHIAANMPATIVNNDIVGANDGSFVSGIGIIGVGQTLVGGNITNNVIRNTYRGIDVANASTTKIRGNTVQDQTLAVGAGIRLQSATDIFVDASNSLTGTYTRFVDTATSTIAFLTNRNLFTGIYSFFFNRNVGIGTTTPLANLSIHANAGDTNTTLFAIASSTASATTTLFAVTNIGSIQQLGGASSSLSNGVDISTGCFSISGACISGATGSSYGEAWQFFNSKAWLAPSTTVGIMVLSSSTIGNGATGLTIFGGATTTGFMAVGTTTSVAPLTVSANASTPVNLNSSLGLFVNRYGATTGAFGVGFPNGLTTLSTQNDMVFATGLSSFGNTTSNVERMRLSTTGRLGIATTTPGTTLGVTGKGIFTDEVTARFFTATSTTVASTFSNVGIASTTPWRNLGITGTVAINGLTAAAGTPNSLCINATTHELVENAALTCTVSSARFKNTMEELDIPAAQILLDLKPTSFFYNDRPDRQRWGFIAEDLSATDPHLSEYDADGRPNSIDFPALFAVIVGTIQDMLHHQDETDARLEVLEGKIAALEARNSTLQLQANMCAL